MVKILICDDDRAFVQLLSQKVSDLAAGWGEAVTLETADPQTITPRQLADPDIAFLDIDMGPTDGIDLARRMRRCGGDTLLIFVTNYPEYAPEGYEVSAFRFLDKHYLNQKLPYYFSQALQALHSRQRPLALACLEEDALFPARCLVYAETQGRQLALHMTRYPAGLLHCRKTMAQLEELLADRGFLRIHQSFLVNMEYLRKMQSTGVWLTTGEALPISARNYQQLKRSFLTWRAKNPWNTF